MIRKSLLAYNQFSLFIQLPILSPLIGKGCTYLKAPALKIKYPGDLLNHGQKASAVQGYDSVFFLGHMVEFYVFSQ